MLDQKTDEPLMRAERGAVNAERSLVGVVTVFVSEVESSRLGKIDLVSRDGKFAANRAPDLDIDLRSVESSFVRHFDVINAGILQHAARHVLGLFP